MNAYHAIIISAVSYSFFPLMNAFGMEHTSSVMFTSLNHVAVIIVCYGILSYLLGSVKKPYELILAFRELPKRSMMTALFSGTAIYLGMMFFLISMSLMSRAGAAVIAEIWPILAIFTIPLLIDKNWGRVRALDIAMMILGLIGVYFIAASEKGMSLQEFRSNPFFLFHGEDFSHYTGILMALLAAYCFSFSTVTRSKFCNELPEKVRIKWFGKRETVAESLYTYIMTYILMLPFALVIPFAMGYSLNPTIHVLWPALLNGFFLTFLSSFYSYALLIAKNPNINIMWYSAPLMAAIWLWLFDFSEITELIMIGAGLIIIANVIYILSGGQDSDAIAQQAEENNALEDKDDLTAKMD